MSRIIKCECCGVEFEAQLTTRKFCTPYCRSQSWNKKNPEKLTGTYRYSKYKKTLNALNVKWRAANKEKKIFWDKRWRETNPEKVKENRIKWKNENSEKYKALKRKGSYRKLGYPEELLEIKELQYQIKKEIKNQLKGENNVNN